MLSYRFGKVEYHDGPHNVTDAGWQPHRPHNPAERLQSTHGSTLVPTISDTSWVGKDVTKQNEQLVPTSEANTSPNAANSGGSTFLPQPTSASDTGITPAVQDVPTATAAPAATSTVAPTATPTAIDPGLSATTPAPVTAGRDKPVDASWNQYFLETKQQYQHATDPDVQKHIQGTIYANLSQLGDPTTQYKMDETYGMDVDERNRLNEVIRAAINVDIGVFEKGTLWGIGIGAIPGIDHIAPDRGQFLPEQDPNRPYAHKYAANKAATAKDDIPLMARKRMVYHALLEQGFTDEQLESLEVFDGRPANLLTGDEGAAADVGRDTMAAVNAPPADATGTTTRDTDAGPVWTDPVANQYTQFIEQASNIFDYDVNTPQGRASLEQIARGEVSGYLGAETLQLPPGYFVNASGELTIEQPAEDSPFADQFTQLPPEQEAQLENAIRLRTQAQSILNQHRNPELEEKRVSREWEKYQADEVNRLQRDLQASNQTHEVNMQNVSLEYQDKISLRDDTLSRDLAAQQMAFDSAKLEYEVAWNNGQVGRAKQISDNQYQNDMKMVWRQAAAEEQTIEKTFQLEQDFGRDPVHLIQIQGTQDRLARSQEIREETQAERGLIALRGSQERHSIATQGNQERLSIAARGAIDKSLETMRQSGQTNRLAMQITSDELMQGNQITHEEAMQKAELTMRETLQNAQLEHAVSQLSTEGQQMLAQIKGRGKQDRKTLAKEIQSREAIAGNQITHEEAMQKAQLEHQTTLQSAGITEAGAEERTTLREQQTIAQEERAALGITTGADAVSMARQTATSYIGDLNTAMQNAVAGDYANVDAALAAELPPVPAGVVWSSQTGVFQQRGGFEGRQMDAETQRWISAATPAFKARDRAEQALTQARTLQLESDLRIRERRAADEDFRQAMLTADIDTAEEAITRQRMAETQQLEVETKMQNMQMLLSLLQNPVQLGMAKRHGLLGQIETALGFQIGNVPTAPAAGQAIPTPEEWQSLDSEGQAFRIATYVEQGGSPEEFMQMIAAGSPGQMQQLQYGVL